MEIYEQRLREKVLAEVGVQKMLQLEVSSTPTCSHRAWSTTA